MKPKADYITRFKEGDVIELPVIDYWRVSRYWKLLNGAYKSLHNLDGVFVINGIRRMAGSEDIGDRGYYMLFGADGETYAVSIHTADADAKVAE